MIPEGNLDALKRWNSANPLSPGGLTVYLNPRSLGGFDYYSITTQAFVSAIASLISASVTDPDLLAIAALSGSGFLKRVGDGNWAVGTISAADVSGLGSAALASSGSFAPQSHTHADATSTQSGFFTAAEKLKLAGIAANANAYVHPAGDGNLHVPATGTGNNTKFLMAGPSAGSLTWSAVPVTSVAGRTGPITLNRSDVGLSNADNTADTAKPISTLQAAAFANRLRIDAAQGLTSGQQATGRANLGLGTAATAAASSFAAVAHTHPDATTSTSGFFTPAEKIKLASLTPGGYTPPTGDGFLYVPATGTTHLGQVLTAGTTAGSISWQLPAVTSVFGRTGAVTGSKSDVGLSNVDNTADASKPISSAVATALSGKAATTHTHSNASTSVPGFMSDTDKTKLDGVAIGAQVNTVFSVNTLTGAVVLGKADVGLGNVDNTSDATKPVSTAQTTAINAAVTAGTAGMLKYTSQSLSGPQQLIARLNISAQGSRPELFSYANIGIAVNAAASVDLTASNDWLAMHNPGSPPSITQFLSDFGNVRTIQFQPNIFTDTQLIVHDGDKIVIPGGQNIALRNNDLIRLRFYAANKVIVESVQRADGSPFTSHRIALGDVTGSTTPTGYIAIGDAATVGASSQDAVVIGQGATGMAAGKSVSTVRNYALISRKASRLIRKEVGKLAPTSKKVRCPRRRLRRGPGHHRRLGGREPETDDSAYAQSACRLVRGHQTRLPLYQSTEHSIASRCTVSPSLRGFLGDGLEEQTPDPPSAPSPSHDRHGDILGRTQAVAARPAQGPPPGLTVDDRGLRVWRELVHRYADQHDRAYFKKFAAEIGIDPGKPRRCDASSRSPRTLAHPTRSGFSLQGRAGHHSKAWRDLRVAPYGSG